MRGLIIIVFSLITIAHSYEICAPGESNTFHRDYSNCRAYIACSEGKAYHDECPKEFYFNPEKSACDFPHNVRCEETCPATGVTAFNLGKSCLKYIQCRNGKATFEECRAGTIFDSNSKMCQHRERANCPFGGKCPDPRAEYSWASKEKCEEYFSCKKGKFSTNTCPDGLHYSSSRQRCDTPANARCPIITTKKVEIKDVEIVCPKTGSHFLPHILDCSKYYVCFNGNAALMSCGALKYDFMREQCDIPSKSQCIVDALQKTASQSIVSTKHKGDAPNVESENSSKATQSDDDKKKHKKEQKKVLM